jgi:hypothetical protein
MVGELVSAPAANKVTVTKTRIMLVPRLAKAIAMAGGSNRETSWAICFRLAAPQRDESRWSGTGIGLKEEAFHFRLQAIGCRIPEVHCLQPEV